ncbi:four-carbon acid sugar kinase family protein [Glaciihabitans sp. INWT7]|uniref:four-carbon acid sugar kinase family protein n=1 Tax=Glaciihabitans sp. INWT7 TaxID=2596912 RepID=UPI00162350AD|nr:four-carbon acid sugar kinase family protein [Glaciihabitans sp. INWT7]
MTSLSAGIVADDLTGAGDSAVQFSSLGWQTRLSLGDPSGITATPGSVVAVVTDSRAMQADAARVCTADAVRALMGAGIDRLFVKIDSTMRGSVDSQVRGALDAWTNRHPDCIAVVCPAYPGMGRTVESGLLLVDGAGVETTSVGRDPVTPVVTSALAELLPGAVAVQRAKGEASQLALLISSVEARVVTVDASTDADLALLAEAIELLGARAVPVGSAGLATQLSKVWRRGEADADRAVASASRACAGPAVVVISSLHDVSRAQHAHLLETSRGVLSLTPGLEDILSPDGDDGMRAWIQSNVSRETSAAVVVILSPPAQAKQSELAPVRIAAALAAITDAVVTRIGAGSLVLMGGEGARAVLGRFDAESLIVTRAIGEGTPVSVIDGGRLHGLTVVTKAGGFGSTSALTDLLPELLEQSTQGASS